MTTSSDKKRCPDDGACHHECLAGCFRVRACGPLSNVYPGDRWPAEVVEAETGYPEREKAAEIIDELFDDYRPVYDEAGRIVTSNIAQELLPVVRSIETRVRREISSVRRATSQDREESESLDKLTPYAPKLHAGYHVPEVAPAFRLDRASD